MHRRGLPGFVGKRRGRGADDPRAAELEVAIRRKRKLCRVRRDPWDREAARREAQEELDDPLLKRVRLEERGERASLLQRRRAEQNSLAALPERARGLDGHALGARSLQGREALVVRPFTQGGARCLDWCPPTWRRTWAQLPGATTEALADAWVADHITIRDSPRIAKLPQERRLSAAQRMLSDEEHRRISPVLGKLTRVLHDFVESRQGLAAAPCPAV